MKPAPLRAVLVGAVAALLGCGSAPVAEQPVSPAAPAATPAATPAAAAVPPSSVAPALAPAPPVELSIPAIGVRTGPLPGLGLDDSGALEVPPDAATAGWYTLGPTPGARGPAVVVGQAGSVEAPGVFHRLHELTPRTEVTVVRADRTTAVFAIYRVERYTGPQFPTERVYGNTNRPELRLLTCGSAPDADSDGCQDHVVAFARLVRVA